ncbi:MAG: hypothetical protein JXA30_07335, partial [Deltaproteobacteria bacterium]|nr:hypothetical protein [Deltaproteobacteria bacterium]
MPSYKKMEQRVKNKLALMGQLHRATRQYCRKRFIRGMMFFPRNNSWLGYGFAGDKPPRYEVFRCYLWLTP